MATGMLLFNAAKLKHDLRRHIVEVTDDFKVEEDVAVVNVAGGTETIVESHGIPHWMGQWGGEIKDRRTIKMHEKDEFTKDSNGWHGILLFSYSKPGFMKRDGYDWKVINASHEWNEEWHLASIAKENSQT